MQQSSISFDAEVIGRPQPWVLDHRGLEYRGEAIVAEALEPVWGRPLEGDLGFRVIFYTEPRRISSERIEDPRIAMAVPRRSLSVESQGVVTELSAVHEARERYATAGDPDQTALRNSMEERATTLREELYRRYARSFSEGRIYTHHGIAGSPAEVFQEGPPELWADSLASAVLLLAFPELPIDHAGFPGTLTPDTVSKIYSGLFQGSPEGLRAVRDFCPGLGLTRLESPAEFDAADCRVLSVIRDELDRAGGRTPSAGMVRTLTEGYGLTDYLALLYLVAFVRQEQAEVEPDRDRPPLNRDGAPFQGDRLTFDLLPDVDLGFEPATTLGELRVESPPTWDSVLPYASIITEGLGPATDEAVIAQQERRLLGRLAEIRRLLAAARTAIDDFAANLAESDTSLWEGLDHLCGATGYLEFHIVIRADFRGPQRLRDAADLVERLARVTDRAPAVRTARTYLGAMRFGPGQSALAVERDSLLAMADPNGLLLNPSTWDRIEERARQLIGRYIHVYAEHHERYHGEAHALSNRLDEVGPQVAAVARFAEMSELGEPLGTELPELFDGISGPLRRCHLAPEDLDLDAGPICVCDLSLDEEVPRRQAEAMLGTVASAMREYNRRLGSHAVRRVLAEPSREQIDRFVDLVRVADPSALANVLDDQVVDFLRQFIRTA